MIGIMLTQADHANVWKLFGAHSTAEIAADCLPSGCEFVISVVPGVGSSASLHIGPATYDLGEAIFSDVEGVPHVG